MKRCVDTKKMIFYQSHSYNRVELLFIHDHTSLQFLINDKFYPFNYFPNNSFEMSIDSIAIDKFYFIEEG